MHISVSAALPGILQIHQGQKDAHALTERLISIHYISLSDKQDWLSLGHLYSFFTFDILVET